MKTVAVFCLSTKINIKKTPLPFGKGVSVIKI